MKNKLSDLQNHLFEMMERLMEYDEEDLEDEKLDRKLKIHMAFNEHAKIAVANGALMAKCVDLLYRKSQTGFNQVISGMGKRLYNKCRRRENRKA
jgi:hypothetical protein